MNITQASVRNVGIYGLMIRENFKWQNHKKESTDAVIETDRIVVVKKFL
jgi:hypothetical protein